MDSTNERYEGDYGCQAHEGETSADKCPNVATQVRREPWTPGRFAVLLCDEHADSTYDFDKEATDQLARDVAREALMMEVA